MKFITTKMHGLLDYPTGLFLISSPWIFGFADATMAQWIPVAIGVMALVTAFFTRYELGFVWIVPMSVHLTLDVFSGLFLAASPWLFQFADRVFWPHVILGLFEAGTGLFTDNVPREGIH